VLLDVVSVVRNPAAASSIDAAAVPAAALPMAWAEATSMAVATSTAVAAAVACVAQAALWVNRDLRCKRLRPADSVVKRRSWGGPGTKGRRSKAMAS
jgi:hypothetical protein